MKFNIYTKLFCIALVTLLISALFTLGASATLGFRSGGISGGMSRSSDSIAEDTAGEDGIVHEPSNSGSDTMMGNNGDTADGGTAAGTGEFGDDTSDTSGDATDNTSRDTMNDTSGNSNNNPVDSAIDNAVTDATNAVDDMTGGMSVWGIVIVIAIIAAIAVLVFAFFSRKK